MEKYHLLPFLLLFACSNPKTKVETTKTEKVYSEKQQPDFNGIYEFKINKTTVKDLDTMQYKREKTYSGYKDISKEFPEVKIIQLANIDKKDFTLESIKLYFFRDTLIEFTAFTNYIFLDILKSKYPNYVLNYEYDKINWYNKEIQAEVFKGRFSIKDIFKTKYIWDKIEAIEKDSLINQNKDL